MIVHNRISMQTRGNGDIVDVTHQVSDLVAVSGISNGTVTLFVTGSTAGITTIEYESGLVSDFTQMWDRLVPTNIVYDHDRRWGDGNGHAHVRASLLGSSLVIPIVDKRMTLGTWQQIIVVDFDNRPRSREIAAQVMGE